jgi:rfaE bifunctional protein nucleotidyltransferase chain/domain
MFTYPSYIQPLPYYREPIQAEVIARTHEAKKQGKKIVIASGVFDLLHSAHKEYLKKAKEQGDYLVVLVESDVRTKELKGEGRPIWNQAQRKDELSKLPFVDEVMILPPEFKNPLRFEEIVILLAPDIYASSSNSVALDHKQKLMTRYGGEMRIVLQEIPGVSTSAVIAENNQT